MNVNDIRNRILELSHDEVDPNNALESKALGWLNSAYHEVMDEALPWLGDSLRQEVTLTADSSGLVTPAFSAFRLLSVVDVTNAKLLREVTREELQATSPALDATGAPIMFYKSCDTLQLYPQSSVDVKISYIPNIDDLNADDAEDTILLPRQFHHALVWGGLVWASTYERGFATQGELQLFQRKWDEAKRNLKLSLASTPTGPRRVDTYSALA